MAPAQWQRIKAIVFEAMARDPLLRSTFIAEACAGDSALIDEVSSLVDAMEQVGDRFEKPQFDVGIESAAVRSLFDAPIVGSLVGPYRIVRELGRGGMGSVYLAERADGEFERHVAIKFVAGSVSSEVLLRRFREERRILATLDHPNIARLFDGGTTADGLPYLVMEYVAGVPITEYCESQGLGIRRRVELVQRVCEAVQYAHQRLVIHRDVKANNILVTPDGTPKLLDFGIATLAEPGPVPTARTTLRAHTLATASPEQLRGGVITIAVDVYALGLLLFELLAGARPFEAHANDEPELIRAICEETPPPPSTVAAASLRRAHERVERDLDLIVLKALRKEPERRYQSVAQFADDLQRYLDGRTVGAAPDSARYRTAKFVRRHRASVAAAAAVLVAILTGTGVALYQTRIAERERAVAQQRFEMVRRLADSVVFEFNDALQGVSGTTAARKLIVTRAIEYLDSLSRQEATDVSLARQLASAYARIGDIQGNPYQPNLGDSAGAMASYQHAITLYEELERHDPSPETRTGIAQASWLLGSLHWAKGDADAARRSYSRALAIYDGLGPSNSQIRYESAKVVYALGQVDLLFGDPRKAAVSYDRARREYEALLSVNPADKVIRRGLAISLLKLGDVANRLGDQSGALEFYRRSSKTFDELLAVDPTAVDLQRIAALTWLRFTELRDVVSPEERERLARRAINVAKPLADADPSNVQAAVAWQEAQQILAQALLDRGRIDEADSALHGSVIVFEHLLATNPGNVEARRIFGYVRQLRGNFALRRGAPRDAVDEYEKARGLLESPDVAPQAAEILAALYDNLGDAYARLDSRRGDSTTKHDDAARWYHRSQEEWTAVASQRTLSSEQARERSEVERKLATAR